MTTASQARYHQYLQSDAWRSIKASCLAERGSSCERCGSKYRIEVHHKEYPKVWGTETTDMLEVLCHKCHLSHHIQTAEAVKVTTRPTKGFPTKKKIPKWLRKKLKRGNLSMMNHEKSLKMTYG